MYDYGSVLTLNFYTACMTYFICWNTGFMLTHFSPFLTQKFNTLSLLQRQTCRSKDGWMRAQKEGQGREKARGSVKLKSVSLITQWLKIFELFTGCIVYMFGIFKQNCISCSVTIPVKLLKRNQAKSQAPVCYAVSNLKANSSLTHSRFHAGGNKPLTVPLSASQIMSSVKDQWVLMIRWPPYWEVGPRRAICIANKMVVTKLQLTLNITKSAVQFPVTVV